MVDMFNVKKGLFTKIVQLEREAPKSEHERLKEEVRQELLTDRVQLKEEVRQELLTDRVQLKEEVRQELLAEHERLKEEVQQELVAEHERLKEEVRQELLTDRAKLKEEVRQELLTDREKLKKEVQRELVQLKGEMQKMGDIIKINEIRHTSNHITRFVIYGERCSGTTYIDQLMVTNFYLENVTRQYDWKHFFGFHKFDGNEIEQNTLFIGIVRNELEWLNSFYRTPHHLPPELTASLSSFLFNTFYSLKYNGYGEPIKEDLNYNTNTRYVNIFDMRKNKIHFLTEIMPTQVKNYVLINYDDLCKNYTTILQTLQKTFNLFPKSDTIKNITYYKDVCNVEFKVNPISFTYADIEKLAGERGLACIQPDEWNGTTTVKNLSDG